jgi:23S rRNA (adenine2503-C2)-methyltransferase
MQVKRIDSSDANVSKYVYDFGDAVAEAVLYKYPTYEERTVICCSTQSGCPVGCRFCGAGDNFVRSLSGLEIVAQVMHLFTDRNIDPTKVKKGQIMFMSMGEPLLNRKGLEMAIGFLATMYPQFALLISTSAPDVDYEWVRDLSRKYPSVGLQFSVHESTDEARNKLIPFKAKLTLAQIADEGEKWFYATGRHPFFNYCANEHNSTQADADRLAEYFNSHIWQATISVVCERDESVAAANSRQRQLATDFMEKLNIKGFSTRCFDPAGQDDIGGGCGQLWYVQDWMAKHPDLARPSIGRTIPIVHAPREIV